MTESFCTNLTSLSLMPADATAAALNVRFPDDPPYTEAEVTRLTSRALAKLRRLAARHRRLFDLMWSEAEPEAPLLPLMQRIKGERVDSLQLNEDGNFEGLLGGNNL